MTLIVLILAALHCGCDGASVAPRRTAASGSECRQLALDAAARQDYNAFHDLAWRTLQAGPKNDPALMTMLARAQSLSGRPHDALVMLQRLAAMGVVDRCRDERRLQRRARAAGVGGARSQQRVRKASGAAARERDDRSAGEARAARGRRSESRVRRSRSLLQADAAKVDESKPEPPKADPKRRSSRAAKTDPKAKGGASRPSDLLRVGPYRGRPRL